jgi:catechol 2,3-dioxygenase-like lactoylglutathione lyase family enzyme
MPMSLGLVSIYCQDLERARAFYTETLGLAIAEPFSGPDFIFLVAGTTGVALRPVAEAPEGAQAGAGSIELSFLVEDVHATRADLIARGVEVTTEVGDVGAGFAFLARDPEGHMLAFAQLNVDVAAGREKLGL